MIRFGLVLAAALGLGVTLSAEASEAPKAPAQAWPFNGPLGTYDRNDLRRGLTVYRNVCASCHSLHLVSYRHLAGVGFTEEEIKTIAAAVEVEDGPNDQGEKFSRAGRPADRFKSPFANPQAARAANNGAFPPDLSVITKARKGGPDYLYGLLTGYKNPPAGFKVLEGMNYNEYFPGHQIAMPAPLNEGGVEYPDGTKSTVQQMAHDVTTFLSWASEPEMEERKRMGLKVLMVIFVLTALLYGLKRQIWAALH
ncbi:MAG: cytochrome c1 [Rhodospirillales bacterium]|nr:cytochrome c1 [Rhodospirillales bacterium]